MLDVKTAQSVGEIDQQWVMGTYLRQAPLFVRGEGARLYDSEGKEYLDFIAGVAVCSIGHCHPRLVDAISRQAATLMHVSNLYLTEPQAKLAEKLCAISGMDKVFYVNSGAEAVETAIKIARKHAQTRSIEEPEIIAFHGAFHGRSMGALSATAQPKYQDPFKPLLPGFRYVDPNDARALNEAFNPSTCAVLVEPIQGESGVKPINPLILHEARALCDKHGALLILDEVQCGMGRTGRWFVCQKLGIAPDLMTVAKGLGGGFPIGACLARGEVADLLKPGEHGSTFGGNALACTAALAVIETIEQENLLVSAERVGHELQAGLKKLTAAGLPISQVRGAGLLIGIGLTRPIAKAVCKAALERGLLVNPVGEDTIRMAPPLIITERDAAQAMDILQAAFSSVP